ncbi:MAG: minor capsid protein [Clostridium sp.]|nr:minor capsid protein [Clostridium sp.]MCM1460646.1 minor capsid protein [Bacteroides sp.]
MPKRIKKAQKYLDERVVKDSESFVPRRDGKLIESGTDSTVLGTGKVIWATPYAHYQYEGRAMVGKESRSAYAYEKETKEYNGKSLNYHTAGTGDHWIEPAKEKYMETWKKGIANILTTGEE